MSVSINSRTMPDAVIQSTYRAEFEPSFRGLPPQHIVVDGVGTLRHEWVGTRRHREYGSDVLAEPIRATLQPQDAPAMLHRIAEQRVLIGNLTNLTNLQRDAVEIDRTPVLGQLSSLLGVGVGLGMVVYGLAQQHTAVTIAGAVLLGGEWTFYRRLQQEARASFVAMRRAEDICTAMRPLMERRAPHPWPPQADLPPVIR